MPKPSFALVLVATLVLAAWDKEGKGVTINASIDGNDSEPAGNTADVNGDGGNVSLSIPGFSANIKMPGGLLAKSEFDIDGVKLPPGGQVTAMNVDAKTKGKSGVKFEFAAPGAPAEVRDWFAKSFAAKSVAIVPSGAGLAGKTADGDLVTMTFAPAGGGQTHGFVDIIDSE